MDFNQNWRFSGETVHSSVVNLPHDAMLKEKRNGVCRNGVNSGYFPGGKYRYEKTIEIEEAVDKMVQ